MLRSVWPVPLLHGNSHMEDVSVCFVQSLDVQACLEAGWWGACVQAWEEDEERRGG